MAQGRPSRIRPAGLWIAVLGPDGSGKSALIAELIPAVSQHFAAVERFHLRPHLLPGSVSASSANTAPHSLQPRGGLLSAVKILYLLADYWLGFVFRVSPLLAQSKLVLFDRYFHDILIDPHRLRYGGPQWLARCAARAIPPPHLVFILDAPPQMLQSRKQEVSAEESLRQAEAYRALAKSEFLRGRAVLIDASRPLTEVVSSCKHAIEEWLAKL